MLVSIIMPTLDEADNVTARHAEIARQRAPWDWIVADGASRDATPTLARALGARVAACEPGRGAQLDCGAEVARGDVLLFLHADTVLPPDALAAIRRALENPAVVGGNFALRFDPPTRTARFFARAYALQQRLFGVYYGDSAVFVRAETYRAIGGFGRMPIMEDYAFVRRLSRAGKTVRLPIAVTTSARRFEGRPLRALVTWLRILVLYHLGVAPSRLARLYRPHRANGRARGVAPDQQQAPPV
ncbi:MAG: TIGR04283 family arsenosugar biosynthesis glycosyltransferase [Vulcanimicrobiaceae bacterium]